MIGETISHYKIIEKLGEGGMGVVYKAHDTKLDRFVALKFLPKGIEADETEKARFMQEARAASALNHPNVCIIYDIAEEDDQQFIVMEYVDGVTLRQKIVGAIRESSLPLKDVIEWAIQIGSALQAAHSKDITHRDIKSDNIMINISNQVKVMDFGLAKLKGALKLTKTSSTVGTLAYMSPEQIQGKETDARVDIFSFGVVFYEMLTAHLPFKAEYESALMYSILNTEPEPVTKYRPELPSGFLFLLDKALEKEPDERYQSINEMLVDLRRLKRDTSRVSRKAVVEMHPAEPSEQPAVTAALRPKKFVGAIGRLPLFISASALVILLVVVGYLLWRGEEVPTVSTSVLRLTNATRIATSLALEGSPTWSPDGGRLAYQSNQSGNMDIWVTQLGVGSPVNLTADYTGSDRSPRWSPDGSQIAFRSDRDGGGCFVMQAIGGTPYKVKAGSVSYPCWSPDGQEIAYRVRDTDSAAYFVEIVSLQGGTPRRLQLQVRENEGPMHLSWSPDGRYFAYVSTRGAWLFTLTSQLWLLRVADEECFPVTDGEMKDWQMTWSRNGSTLYFVSNRGGLFDLWQQSLSDDGKPVGSPQQVTTGQDIKNAKLSPDGTKLAYVKGPFAGFVANMWRVSILDDRPATWADAQQLTFEQANVQAVDVSPDGKQLVFHSNIDGIIHIWKMPVEGGEIQRVTINPMEEHIPRWSPDGREIAFHSLPGLGNSDIWVVPVGGGQASRVTHHEARDQRLAWSPNGREITFVSNRSGNDDIWIIPAQGGEARQVTVHPAMDTSPDWSPDGKWILFTSNRTGYPQLWRVPPAGGRPEPLTEEIFGQFGWGIYSLNGKNVYFKAEREGARNFWEVPAEGGAERQLTDFAGKYGRLSSECHATDGKYIYFTWREDISDIWVMDVVENE